MNSTPPSIDEIKRQGRLTRWTVILAIAAAAIGLAFLFVEPGRVVRFLVTIFILAMMAGLVAAIARSLFSGKRETDQ